MAAYENAINGTTRVRTNVGLTDQNLRIAGGVSMMIVAIAVGSSGALLGIAGTLLLLTANFGLCPLYTVAGISTCGDNEDD